ncbi:protein THEM6 isoform X1 [Pteropus medius]|nr:protein THEM6 isoform X1 [Pteropus giganteus]
MKSAPTRCRCGAPRAALSPARPGKATGAVGRDGPLKGDGEPGAEGGALAYSTCDFRRVHPSAGFVRWFAPAAPRSPVPGLAGPAPAAAQRAPAGTSVAGSATMLLVALLAIALAYFALLDGWYLVRVPCAVLRARLLQPRVRYLLAEQRYADRVLPSDLDLLLHMNNARYLREADVAHVAHLARCGVLGALRALGASSVLAASCARYRRSLRLLEPFEVRTRLLGWDDRAFYLEARFVSLRDGFVCALLRTRQHVLGASPERVVQHLCKRRVEPPELPADLQHWVAYNEASSQLLRAESGLGDAAKDQ